VRRHCLHFSQALALRLLLNKEALFERRLH